MLETIAHIMISPINQSLFGIALGFILLEFTKLKRFIGKFLICISLFWVALCSQYFFSYWLIAPLEKAFPPIPVKSKVWHNANAIWVLACYHFKAESLPLVSQFNQCSIERLVQAANMYRVKPTPIYLTGGKFNVSSDLSYASQAAKFLQELGVNAIDITIVDIGTDTLSEANEITKLIEQKKLAVISSATHGVRLSKILSSNNIDFIFVPVHFETKGKNVFRLNSPSSVSLVISERAFYEYAALVEYWLNTSE